MVDGSRQIFSFVGCTYLASTIYLGSLSVSKIPKHLLKQWRGSKALATAGWQSLRSPGTKVALVESFSPICSTKVESLKMHHWGHKTLSLYRVHENNKDKENSNDNDETYTGIECRETRKVRQGRG